MDAEFPPDDGSLFFSERQYGLEWRRAAELVAEPSLMEGGGDRLDINQVRCCNCSFKTLCDILSNPPVYACSL